MFESLNRSVVVAGAMMTLLIAGPAAIVTAWLADDDGGNESNWTLLALLAIVIAYLLGGALAGRGVPEAPFGNGAAATLLAFVVIQGIGIAFRLGRGDGINLVALVFNGLLAASFGTFGAWFGGRFGSRITTGR